jgi:hypothetical protein
MMLLLWAWVNGCKKVDMSAMLWCEWENRPFSETSADMLPKRLRVGRISRCAATTGWDDQTVPISTTWRGGVWKGETW